MKIKYLLLVVCVMFYSVSVEARDVTGKIVDLITWHDGHTVIKLENGPINGCSGQYYYSLGINGQDVKAEPMFSVALAAYLANRTVRVSSIDGVCHGGEEKLFNIRILPN